MCFQSSSIISVSRDAHYDSVRSFASIDAILLVVGVLVVVRTPGIDAAPRFPVVAARSCPARSCPYRLVGVR